MPIERSTPLFLVSGFLGAGKTTFINNLITSYPDSRFGIIVNDFGEIGVDAFLIKNQERNIVKELNNGQIFCSCLSGSFVKSVSEYSEIDIDYLLVETSGLAKPSPLFDILGEVKKLNGRRFIYHGMISIVDSSSYLKLSKVLNAVNEQIFYSDLVLMNKIDQTDSEAVKRVEMEILAVNPQVRILRTEFGRAPGELLEGMKEKTEIAAADRRFSGWGSGRPVPLSLRSKTPVPKKRLEVFINSISDVYYRLKGGIESDEGPLFIDCTRGQMKITIGSLTTDGLVVILPADDNIVRDVRKRASELFDLVS
ncbi:MAG: GTP-binding protein [Spirochaetales bacterium]|nr:GTP-binding protein [Spirochaetales bacterium]